MSTIGEGGHALPPHVKEFYKEKFEHSVDLFQRGLEKYEHAEFIAKKEQYMKVMERCLHVMNEAAKAGIGKEAKYEAHHLQEQYDEVFKHKERAPAISNEDMQRLQDTINKLKKSTT